MADTPQNTGNLHPDAPAAWRGLTGALLKYAEARGLLAQIEVQEALGLVIWAAVYGVLSMILTLGAWLLIVPATVYIVSRHMGWPVDKALVITGIAHALIAVIILRTMVARIRRARWFKETLQQLEKDRSWIRQQTGKP
jgi:uncharacterized membrane protein YqjE